MVISLNLTNLDPVKREIVGDAQANSFLSRESRKGFETKANV